MFGFAEGVQVPLTLFLHKNKELTKSEFFILVREKGLEPSRTYVHMNLNHTRLPVPPSPHINFFNVIFITILSLNLTAFKPLHLG